MGTTAEKLAYLKETKNQIKNALETPSNIFRDYPSLIKKYIDNQPTKKVTDGVCSNAVDVPMVGLGIDGNSEQKSYSGKNLANIKNIPNNSVITVLNDKITLANNSNGIGYIGTSIRLKQLCPNLKIDDKVILTFDNTSSSLFNDVIYLDGINEKWNKNTSKTITQTILDSKIILYGGYNETAIISNFMIRLTSTNDTYEPYVGGMPSPNPSYPQKIEVVDGCNRFDETEILKAEGWTKNSDGYYNGSFLKWNNAFDTKTSGFTIKGGFRVNTQYILLFKGYVSGGTASFRIKYDDETFSNYLFSNTSEELHTIVSTAGKNVVGLYGTYTRGGGNTLYVKDVQFIEGTALKPYLPYGSIGLKQSGKNLCNLKLSNYIRGSNVEKYDNGYKLIAKQETENYGSYVVFQTGLKLEDYLDQTLYVSVHNKPNTNNLNSLFRIGYWKLTESFKELKNISMNEEGIFKISTTMPSKIPSDYRSDLGIIILINVETENLAIGNNIIVTDFMISKEDTSYEPYHEPKLIPINLNGNSLAKVGDIKDKLIIHRNGEVEIEKKVGKYVFTGKENGLSMISQNRFNLDKSIIDYVYKINAINYMSNSYNAYRSTSNNAAFDELVSNEDYGFNLSSTSKTLRIKDIRFLTLEQYKQWLADKYNEGVPVYIYYVLEEPQTIKLPSIEPIELWEGTNIFKLITNLDTTFEMEYVVNKDYIMNTLEPQNLLNIVEGENI